MQNVYREAALLWGCSEPTSCDAQNKQINIILYGNLQVKQNISNDMK